MLSNMERASASLPKTREDAFKNATKEMTQPCLIHLDAISLIVWKRMPAHRRQGLWHQRDERQVEHQLQTFR